MKTALILAMGLAVVQNGAQRIDLAQALAAGKLRAVNRDVTALPGTPDAVHLSEKADPGIVWVEGSDLGEGTIEVDVRGRDVAQRSFLGIAFHGTDDRAYECVYVRPFNFRASDPARRRHAVQYMTLPEYDWPRLRTQFPEQFEKPVDPSVSPTDWTTLRVVVTDKTIRVFVGSASAPALEARKLGTLARGRVGLWTGNGSDGDFRNLRMTPAR